MRFHSLVIASVFLVAFASDSWGQSQEPPIQAPDIKTEQKPDSAAKSQPKSNDQASPSNPKPPIEQQHPTNDPKGEADKDADKRAEEAREYWPFDIFGARLKITDSLLALFTFLLIVVGGVQGIFLFRTDRGTHKAADAAKESADVARDSLIYTQRAYVRVANFPWLWRPDNDRPGKCFYDITPIIENGGNTPTEDMTINIQTQLRDTELPENFDFPYSSNAGRTLIGAHQSVGAAHAHILDDDLLKVQKGENFFYIWGDIEYRDVFKNTPVHHTEFCTQIISVIGNPLDPKDPVNPKGTSVEIGFHIHTQHNKTD